MMRGMKRSLSVDDAHLHNHNHQQQHQLWRKPAAAQQQPPSCSTSSGPWFLEKGSNVLMYERPPIPLHHVHPDVEGLRAQLMLKLRTEYGTMCRSREGIEPPKESFNRWLLERKVIDAGSDPLFPTSCHPEISRAMYAEIMQDIPCRLQRPKYPADARKQLSRYAEGAKALIESRTASPESRKIVKWNVEDAFQWMRRVQNASFEEYGERLRHLRQQCQPHLTEAAKGSVEAICSKTYAISCEDGKKVAEKQASVLREAGVDPRPLVPMQQYLHQVQHQQQPSSNQRKVFCYPIQLAAVCLPASKVPVVQFAQEKELVHLAVRNDALSLKAVYLHKLECLYRSSCHSDRKLELFLPRVWCLLRRYKSALGPAAGEGHASQVALPIPVMESLASCFEVSFEAFASPLNCCFRSYCSAFPDTDGYFGSRGSFLSFHPIAGSILVHPPSQEELADATVEHMERCLVRSGEPLSFVVFLADWGEAAASSRAVKRLEASRFKRKQLTLEAGEHEFRNGFQHVCDQRDLMVKSPHRTLVFFVQNDAGFLRWGPTPDRIEALLDACKVGREAAAVAAAASAAAAAAAAAAASAAQAAGQPVIPAKELPQPAAGNAPTTAPLLSPPPTPSSAGVAPIAVHHQPGGDAFDSPPHASPVKAAGPFAHLGSGSSPPLGHQQQHQQSCSPLLGSLSSLLSSGIPMTAEEAAAAAAAAFIAAGDDSDG